MNRRGQDLLGDRDDHCLSGDTGAATSGAPGTRPITARQG